MVAPRWPHSPEEGGGRTVLKVLSLVLTAISAVPGLAALQYVGWPVRPDATTSSAAPDPALATSASPLSASPLLKCPTMP